MVLVAIALWRPARPSSTAAASARAFGFVVVAPRAATVSLVGDFNDWDAARTPMQRTRKNESVWTAVIPLTPGRYRYGFLVDGVAWLADPAAPAARDDEFGTPSSVVTVGGS
jgi:1,4-alpha-glucan branching enzyme